MKTSQKGIDFIKRHEALRLNAYLDAAGVWTIGYGHTSTAKKGMTITEAEAEKLLVDDLKHAEDEINSHNLPLKQHQFDALASFVFNVGTGAFRTSTLLKRIKIDVNHPDIPNQLNRWIYVGGKVLSGLVKRRRQEVDIYTKVHYEIRN